MGGLGFSVSGSIVHRERTNLGFRSVVFGGRGHLKKILNRTPKAWCADGAIQGDLGKGGRSQSFQHPFIADIDFD